MKITVEFSESQLKEICRVTGERKKGSAVRKLVAETLQLRRRAALAQNFISGTWGVELETFEQSQAAERRNAESIERRRKSRRSD